VLGTLGGRESGHGLIDRMHRHGFVKPDVIGEEVRGAGFAIVESAPLGVWNLHFVLARPDSGQMMAPV